MCGLVGFINLNGDSVSPITLKKMTDVIAHRGPDGEGHWIKDNVGIGHRRLAIIDLTPAGNQPMISSDHRYVLSYNGEIYNFRELRTELEAVGYIFNSKTDSEVVLYAFAHWGNDALLRFNGMFALALWDCKTQTLLLARDRYGIKPLYYTNQGNRFSFASEQKAIIIQSEFNRKLNPQALFEYFTFQNIFTDQTLLKDIYLLPAGHYLNIHLKPYHLQLKCYWDYRFCASDQPPLKKDYKEELDHLFCQAVNRQLVSDVELGAYLSGGIDSGSITAVASQSLSNLKTFTCGFDLSSASGIELAFDERTKAEMISNRFKTDHYEMEIKAGDLERCLPKLAWHLEEPRVGQSYPNYYAAQLTSSFVKVVLSGSGGDELFAGYPWRYFRYVSKQSFENYIDQYYLYWQRLVDNHDLKKMFAPVWSEVKNVWTRDIFREVLTRHDNTLESYEDYINQSLYFEAKTFLHGLFLVEDKLSMSHSLESRVPFMDNDLVDFAMRCPVSLKLKNLHKVPRINENESFNKQGQFYQKTNDGKQILRNVMTKYIPKNITEAVKQGFSSPDSSWFKGESMEFVKSKLLNSNAKIYDVLDKNSVISLVKQHLDGQQNRRLLIWSLLNVEEWMKKFL